MSHKIMVVDDDTQTRELVALMLRRQGYEVEEAATGAQAIGTVDTIAPDLILLDMMMPDMNGVEVCKQLRTMEASSSVPIIMFSAKGMIDDKVAGFEAGVNDYLTKPIHPAELAARIKSILASRSDE